MKLYEHPRCTTCKKAKAYLEKKGIAPEVVDITKAAPSLDELKKAFEKKGSLKGLFNTSGMLYRELGLKERIPLMTEEEGLEILSKQGMLVKRPFLITDKGTVVGFKETEWESML